ncbi:sarcosine oxidase subunit alpha [Wenxinia marina]|uniref:2Fe-2S iron-sulfur cluster-binding protein n=1 Tax=Wenxinia marina TaxID=390641 RepID=UPI000382CF10|nr:2Fe-2S iron-sulfur cluster-binding protein [Wenxinia marina]GGL72890.1 sarcosine oxidase subunit alpha [Wenxinia marina]
MRLDGHGLIDRTSPLSFTFDGRRIDAFSGDTVASALLANGVRLVGRSFKYHRPRGIFTCGSEEPSALVTVGRGQGQEPNARATMVEAAEGLEVRSQNAWPSLRVDVMAAADLLHPFFGAGFYYKTFMWPRAFWERLYEPAIRRAAGLGRLSGVPAEDDADKAYSFCELLVIGAGPAGLMAALTAGRAGADVILADEHPRMGGRLLMEAEEVDGLSAADWAEEAVEELASLPNVRLMPRTTVTGAYDGGVYGALQRGASDTFWRITCARAILASGAIERSIAFPGNDRPGVMLAGAVRGYLHRYGVAAGREVAVFGATDDAHRTARDLTRAGVEAVMLDAREDAPAGDGFEVLTRARVTGTTGRHGIATLTVTHAGGARSLHADCLAVSGGWNPALHFTCHHNGRPRWDEALATFVPTPDAVRGLAAAGAARGDFSTHGALAGGAAAGRDALAALGRSAPEAPLPRAEDRPVRQQAFWMVEATGRKWLDLQNDVTDKDIRLSAQEAFRSVEHMKRYTTQGMAADQGKTSNVAALALLADATGRGIPATGTTTFRPPYVPVPIAAMGAGARGRGFAPERRTAADTDHRRRGAPMIEAGLWVRPSYYPAPGETTWRQSCDREVRTVRERVGVCDVSTLGKIEVQGPDAGAFLDIVYANRMSTLAEGRVRYGLMLREDGHVMDDGTCARLPGGRWIVTTTTAAAGPVMRHMDYARQCLARDLDVSLVSVTDHWTQIAVAGPLARRLLDSLGDLPLLPFMGCAETTLGGAPARLFRISFSGEEGYEIAVPARFGASLWRLAVAQAESLGGAPYGLEALNVLRLEKGFLTHAEMDGRTTAYDLGLGGMVADKDAIGVAASRRPGLVDPDRPRLVGLVPIDPAGVMTAGAHLYDRSAAATRPNGQGHVTSAGHSPTLGHALGLALLRGGPERHGEVIRLVDAMRHVETEVRVGPTCAYDPDGGRMRG